MGAIHFADGSCRAAFASLPASSRDAQRPAARRPLVRFGLHWGSSVLRRSDRSRPNLVRGASPKAPDGMRVSQTIELPQRSNYFFRALNGPATTVNRYTDVQIDRFSRTWAMLLAIVVVEAGCC